MPSIEDPVIQWIGPGDAESTEFILDEIGDREMLDRTEMLALSRAAGSREHRAQSRESYQTKEKGPVTSGQLRDFEPGECITVTRTAWWHGQCAELHTVRSALPARGAESPTASRQADTDAGIEAHDSWLRLVRSKLAESGADAHPAPEAQADETPDDPAVWAAQTTDEKPSITYSPSRWDGALSRLDVDSLPIQQGKNVDALDDLCAMLDWRVLDLQPGAESTAEICDLLVGLDEATGLTRGEIVELVSDWTDILCMSDSFRREYVDAGNEAVSADESSTAAEETVDDESQQQDVAPEPQPDAPSEDFDDDVSVDSKDDDTSVDPADFM